MHRIANEREIKRQNEREGEKNAPGKFFCLLIRITFKRVGILALSTFISIVFIPGNSYPDLLFFMGISLKA